MITLEEQEDIDECTRYYEMLGAELRVCNISPETNETYDEINPHRLDGYFNQINVVNNDRFYEYFEMMKIHLIDNQRDGELWKFNILNHMSLLDLIIEKTISIHLKRDSIKIKGLIINSYPHFFI